MTAVDLLLIVFVLWFLTGVVAVIFWSRHRNSERQWKAFIWAQKQRSLVTTEAVQQHLLTRAYYELAPMRKETPLA